MNHLSALLVGPQHGPRHIGAKLLTENASQALNVGTDFGGNTLFPLIDGPTAFIQLASECGHASRSAECAFNRCFHTRQYRLTRLQMSSIAIRQENHKEAGRYRLLMTFGERLKTLRESAGLSGAALGTALGVSKQTISHWEKGRYEPSQAQLLKLSVLLNVTVEHLLRGEAAAGELGPDSLDFAQRYQALSPAEQTKWRQLVDIVSAPQGGRVQPQPISDALSNIPSNPPKNRKHSQK